MERNMQGLLSPNAEAQQHPATHAVKSRNTGEAGCLL
jgi:hypothetical protein